MTHSARWRGVWLAAVVTFVLARPASAAPFAYVANFGSPNSVSVIDLATETVVTTIPAPAGGGVDPYWVGISRNGKTVAVSLHDSTGVLLIDGATNTALGVVGGVGNEPEGVAVNSTGTTVYVADEDPPFPSSSNGDLYVVDVASKSVVAGPIDLSASCNEPENIVISPDDRFLYIACAGDEVIRVNTQTFAILQLANDTDDAHGVAISCDGQFVYFGDKSVPESGPQAFQWSTASEALTGVVFNNCALYNGAVSPNGQQFYCVEESDSVKIYNTTNGNLLQDVNLFDDDATAVGVHPNGGRIYIPISSEDEVEVVDTVALTNLSTDDIDVGDSPRGIAIASCPEVEVVRAAATGPWAFIGLTLGLACIGMFVALRRHRPAAASP